MKDSPRVLSESMFYVLIALKQGSKSGIEICDYVSGLTFTRVPLPPGTLYTILGKFEDEGLISEIKIEGRKRTYALTELGEQALLAEYQRIQQVLKDYQEVL